MLGIEEKRKRDGCECRDCLHMFINEQGMSGANSWGDERWGTCFRRLHLTDTEACKDYVLAVTQTGQNLHRRVWRRLLLGTGWCLRRRTVAVSRESKASEKIFGTE